MTWEYYNLLFCIIILDLRAIWLGVLWYHIGLVSVMTWCSMVPYWAGKRYDLVFCGAIFDWIALCLVVLWCHIGLESPWLTHIDIWHIYHITTLSYLIITLPCYWCKERSIGSYIFHDIYTMLALRGKVSGWNGSF